MEPERALILNGQQGYHHPDAISMLLAVARQRINEGQPSLALRAVVIALRATGGEAAVLQTLARARDAYLSRMHANSAADELAALFAECVIAESFPKPTLPSSETHDMQQAAPNILPHSVQATSGFEHGIRMESIVGCDEVRAPILAESGRMQILIDAASDGSSFICLHCGGLVSNLRRDEHIAHWCSDAYMM